MLCYIQTNTKYHNVHVESNIYSMFETEAKHVLGYKHDV